MLDILRAGLAPDYVPYLDGWALQRAVHTDVLAGVRPDTLEAHGAVSEQVAAEMARGALAPGLNLFNVVDDFSALAGQTGDLYWNEAREGKFCVRGVSFSFAIDAIDIASAVQVSLELTESYAPAEKKPRVKAEYSLF